MTTTTWILIADGARAHLLVNRGPGTGLERVFAEEFVNPAGRAHVGEMLSDGQGRSFDSVGRGREGIAGGRHAMEPPTDPKRHAQEDFARELAAMLDVHAQKRAFDALILVAAPRMLGDLRTHLSAAVAQRVSHELDKDLTNTPEHDLPQHLGDLVQL